MPEYIPLFNDKFIASLAERPFQEICFHIASLFLSDDIDEHNLRKIVETSINFDAPLVRLNENTHILELWHGPTLAFKDFGARFMARCMEKFIHLNNQTTNILVATSGDTGSAVAHGFYDVEGINVIILYPKGKVSQIQEKQLTTLDKNIYALEIEGTFDDCQRLVKKAFLDRNIKNKINISGKFIRKSK